MRSKYVLNKVPNSNDPTCVVNNMRLTTMGAFSMAAVCIIIMQKNQLTRDKTQGHENKKGSCGQK